MKIKKKKEFKIFHWDTFDNVIIPIDKAKTIEEAREKVKKQYAGRISDNGADVVEIVDENGRIVERHTVC